jgi:DNA-binding transcriptional ArsR family regulator
MAATPAFAAPVFAALGDPIRLSIVTQLCAGGPLPTIRLKERTEISRQAITKHLQILEQAGLVKSDRVGRDRAWRIEPHQLARTRDYLERISAQWDARIERLRAFVEE